MQMEQGVFTTALLATLDVVVRAGMVALFVMLLVAGIRGLVRFHAEGMERVRRYEAREAAKLAATKAARPSAKPVQAVSRLRVVQ